METWKLFVTQINICSLLGFFFLKPQVLFRYCFHISDHLIETSTRQQFYRAVNWCCCLPHCAAYLTATVNTTTTRCVTNLYTKIRGRLIIEIHSNICDSWVERTERKTQNFSWGAGYQVANRMQIMSLLITWFVVYFSAGNPFSRRSIITALYCLTDNT